MEVYSVVAARHHIAEGTYRSFVLVEGYVERSVIKGSYELLRQMCGFLNGAWGLVRAELTGEKLDYSEAFLVQWLNSFDRYEVCELVELLPEHESAAVLVSLANKIADATFTD